MSEQQDNSTKGMTQGEINTAPHKFKPGQSGNPAGRPKGRTLTNRLKAILEEEVNGKTVAQALMEAGVKAALKGDYRYWNHIAERIDGKVAQPHEHTGEDGGALNIIFRTAEPKEESDGT